MEMAKFAKDILSPKRTDSRRVEKGYKLDNANQVIIDKINDKFGTNVTEMDKALVQMEDDYAS